MRLLVIGTLAVVITGVLLRWLGLSRQSYWSDEMFTVSQSSGTFSHMIMLGKQEIHPPLFALIMGAWYDIGASVRPGWMRIPPAFFGVCAILVSLLGLRRSNFSSLERLTFVGATSACGMAIIYSQDVRSYSLLFLSAVGLTAASLRLVGSEGLTRRGMTVWGAWGALGSATHLFGMLLVMWIGLWLLLMSRKGDGRGVVIMVAAAMTPQVAWLLYGATVPGFGHGTSWIPAPTAADFWWLLTTVFGFGNLSMRPDGFRLASPVLVVALGLCFCVAGALRGVRSGRGWQRERSGEPELVRGRRRGIVMLSLIVFGMPTVVFAGSQVVHVWTLRNMIVVAPAMTWLACTALLALAGSSQGRLASAAMLVALQMVALIGVGRAMQTPYKTQFGPAMERLAQLRAQQPTMRLIGGVDQAWLDASNLPATPEEFDTITRPFKRSTLDALQGVTPASPTVTTAYVYYSPWGVPMDVINQRIIDAAGPAYCRSVPFVRVAFVVCGPQ